jgi:hypothetical protein
MLNDLNFVIWHQQKLYFVKDQYCPKGWLGFGLRPLSGNQKRKQTSAPSASRAKRV